MEVAFQNIGNVLLGVAFDVAATSAFGVVAKVCIGVSIVPRTFAAFAFWRARLIHDERKAAKTGW